MVTKKRELLNDMVGDFKVRLEVIENDLGTHDYGIPSQAWKRGVKFMRHFGANEALELIDRRALRATERGDYETARRWRDLITAIHAIQEDERLPGDNVH